MKVTATKLLREKTHALTAQEQKAYMYMLMRLRRTWSDFSQAFPGLDLPKIIALATESCVLDPPQPSIYGCDGPVNL